MSFLDKLLDKLVDTFSFMEKYKPDDVSIQYDFYDGKCVAYWNYSKIKEQYMSPSLKAAVRTETKKTLKRLKEAVNSTRPLWQEFELFGSPISDDLECVLTQQLTNRLIDLLTDKTSFLGIYRVEEGQDILDMLSNGIPVSSFSSIKDTLDLYCDPKTFVNELVSSSNGSILVKIPFSRLADCSAYKMIDNDLTVISPDCILGYVPIYKHLYNSKPYLTSILNAEAYKEIYPYGILKRKKPTNQ